MMILVVVGGLVAMVVVVVAVVMVVVVLNLYTRAVDIVGVVVGVEVRVVGVVWGYSHYNVDIMSNHPYYCYIW